MKKVSLIVAALLVFTMVGCNKKKDCTCKVSVNNIVTNTFTLADQEDCDNPENIPTEYNSSLMKVTCE